MDKEQYRSGGVGTESHAVRLYRRRLFTLLDASPNDPVTPSPLSALKLLRMLAQSLPGFFRNQPITAVAPYLAAVIPLRPSGGELHLGTIPWALPGLAPPRRWPDDVCSYFHSEKTSTK